MDGTYLGVNLSRRKRQAFENAKIVMERFISDIDNGVPIIESDYNITDFGKLDYRVGKFSEMADSLAKTIQPDWAIPILVGAISRMYYDDMQGYKEYGPIFKRAIAHVWKAGFSSNSTSICDASKKNIDSLVALLKISYTTEVANGFSPFFFLCEDFNMSIDKGYIRFDSKFDDEVSLFKYLISGRGRRLRIAEKNDSVMHNPEYLVALQNVLDGKNPSEIELFKKTFYEKIPGIDDENCLKFWQTLFFRAWFYSCLISEDSEELNSAVCLFHEFSTSIPEGYYTQDIVSDTFWNKQWINGQHVSKYSQLIVERPILRMSEQGDFATSAALIGDSINLFIEDSILGYSSREDRAKLPKEVFKRAVSEPFEEEIIDEMVERGFEAGHVSEIGIWNKKWLDEHGIKEENENLRFDDTKLFGEVDTFAFYPNGDLAILIECKVLNDYRDLRSFKNLVGKLKEETEGFRKKVNKKAEWLEKALEAKYERKIRVLKVLLTDIRMPVFDNSEDVYLMDKERLLDSIDKLLFAEES